VQEYTTYRYQAINAVLRGPDAATEIARDPLYSNIDSALAGHPVPEDVVVARGMDLDHIEELPDAMASHTYHDDGYMSTSLGEAAFKTKEAILHLIVPKDTPGAYVEPFTFSKGENELLLGRGLDYHVERVVEYNGKVHIFGEIV
jgi:hypothetical protein